MEKSVIHLGKRRRSDEGVEQSRPGKPRRSLRLAGEPVEYKGLETDRLKRTRPSADAAVMDDGAANGPAVDIAPRPEKKLSGAGINALALETFELMGTYSALGDLGDGTRNLTKYRLLSKGFSEVVDKSRYLAKIETTLHAVSLTKTFIESAHVKRRLDDKSSFLEYEASDGEGNPATWSKKYLADHVDDIYAVMKFSGREYNASLLSAALRAPDGMEKGRMLHQFALNAAQFDPQQHKSIADAAVNILKGGGSGAFLSAKAFLLLKDHAIGNADLGGHIERHGQELAVRRAAESDLHQILSKAEDELDRLPNPLNKIARAASDLSLKYDWCKFNKSVEMRYGEAPDFDKLMVRELSSTPLPVSISDVALKIGAKFEDAMSYRQAETLLTERTKEVSSPSEKRAELAGRSQTAARGD
ncbi:hypothetical protein AM571_PA00238 (plasmid) [Rhizobium etli 8C-3]|uniref:Uncharacterized protein n=2 Tax=Rhizobium etli TaxID=29449 RepID=A0A1L5PAK8_RHIET|nr:hypothetical protein AM571_PA00238 [Rhizobium etli 8C-3]